MVLIIAVLLLSISQKDSYKAISCVMRLLHVFRGGFTGYGRSTRQLLQVLIS